MYEYIYLKRVGGLLCYDVEVVFAFTGNGWSLWEPVFLEIEETRLDGEDIW